MFFEFGFGGGVNSAIKIIGEFVKKVSALHWLPSPLFGFCDPLALSRL
jgi:hypothetical protein